MKLVVAAALGAMALALVLYLLTRPRRYVRGCNCSDCRERKWP